jgi:transposase-like protein
MTLEDKVHAFRLHLFGRAQELGNVSAACRELGVSRSLYYPLRQRFTRYGADGLHPTRRRGRPGRPAQLDAVVERQIVALAEIPSILVDRAVRIDGEIDSLNVRTGLTGKSGGSPGSLYSVRTLSDGSGGQPPRCLRSRTVYITDLSSQR